MLTLLFFRTGDRPVHAAGPVPFVRVAGTSLQIGPDNQNLGHHRGGFWRVAGQDTPKFLVTGSGPLLLEAERPDESIVLGEFGQLEFVDGAIYSHPGSLLLARLDEPAKAWYLYSNGSLHSTLLVEESHLSGSPANATSTATLSRMP
jgi:hypothetical protein